MIRWYWVRHGPTHEKTLVGQRDVPADLSDRAAVGRLDAYLPDGAALWSSDLSRTRATARALSRSRAPLREDPLIREFDFGAWDGLHWQEVAERDPDLSRRFWEAPGEPAPPGGESWNDVAARVGRFVASRHAEGPAEIVAVAHFGVILAALQRATGATPYDTMAHRIEPLSVTELTWDGRGWTVGRINHRP